VLSHSRSKPGTRPRTSLWHVPYDVRVVPVTILVDVCEPNGGVPEALRRIGVHVRVVPMPAGDYEVAAGVIVERKRVLDLHESVRQGRFWGQLGKLRRAASVPYLLVEGLNLYAGPLPHESARGVVLAALEQGVRVVFSTSRDDSALWLRRLAIRTQRNRTAADRPSYAQRPRRIDRSPEAVLAAIPGISVGVARLLLDRFGSVRAVSESDPREWQQVPGVGPGRAAALRDALLL
jgi:DNA excision repair protein ERCC-4